MRRNQQHRAECAQRTHEGAIRTMSRAQFVSLADVAQPNAMRNSDSVKFQPGCDEPGRKPGWKRD